MGNPNQWHVDHFIEEALGRAFDQILKRIDSQYMTAEDALTAIVNGWGAEVADVWQDWYAEMDE